VIRPLAEQNANGKFPSVIFTVFSTPDIVDNNHNYDRKLTGNQLFRDLKAVKFVPSGADAIP